jgi:hypothetical protein
MVDSNTSTGQWAEWMGNPWKLFQAASDYCVDAWQRAILYADIERQVGDQYQAQRSVKVPHVLSFPFEPVLFGTELPRPVNYGMIRILAPKDQPTDETKRPFIVVDPRAGHGPGIGGFKPESEIGAALKAGHPCYFVGFLPDPVPGQTIEDVMRAQAEFVRMAAKLHPGSHGKPVVIGNCQAGWLVLMAAAVWPELFGPIIVAGAPVSYWAGNNPMRYTGGLLGGSWMTALASDLGCGRFDGASLVQNFENLDPANTLWSKQYNVYAKADTEGERYIGFEKYWGGYVFLNDAEMQYIVDNLFIGNKLSTAQLMTSDGIRIDLRNIRSPILVFCSYGDNITPPPQALGWITDLYVDDDDVRSHDQTIVFTTHDSIGHLGIFVSGSVGKKEHRKFASVIEQIDLLPAGLYRATVDEAPEGCGLLDDPYLMSIRRSSIEEIRDIVQPDPESDLSFAAVARLSEINLAFYRSLVQPWVRAFSTPYTAAWLQAWHPMRLEHEAWSSAHPLAAMVSQLAEDIHGRRQHLDEDNPFLQAQADFSRAMADTLDRYRDRRDDIYAILFQSIYSAPLLRALIGRAPGDTMPARPHPGSSPEHIAFVRDQVRQIEGKLHEGGLIEAALRGAFYILKQQGSVDERYYHAAMHLREKTVFKDWGPDAARRAIREQALVLVYHGRKCVDAIPELLRGEDPQRIRDVASVIAQLTRVGEGGKALPAVEEALNDVLRLFESAAQDGESIRRSAPVQKSLTTKPATAVTGSGRGRVAQPKGRPAAKTASRQSRSPTARKSSLARSKDGKDGQSKP